MKPQEFDAHARSYKEVLDQSIGFSGEDSAYFAEYKIRDLHHELTSAGADADTTLKLMDFGCGVGTSMPYARQYFTRAELLGVDVSQESLEQARARHGELASFLLLEDDQWPAQALSLDAAFAMCVLHHVDEALHFRILTDIRRRLKPGGIMMVYEHNPYNPLTVRVVNNCPFDENAKLIRASVMAQRCRDAGYKKVKVRYRVFFPGVLKALRFAEGLLTWLPLGGSIMFAASHRWMSAELVKFASVGGLNTVLGLAIIYSFKWELQWGDASANLAGYLICILLGFVLNGRWTFGKSALMLRHFWGYFLVAAIAYLMNFCSVLLSIKVLDVPGDYAQLVGVPVFTLTSFVLNKWFVFSGAH